MKISRGFLRLFSRLFFSAKSMENIKVGSCNVWVINAHATRLEFIRNQHRIKVALVVFQYSARHQASYILSCRQDESAAQLVRL